MAYARVRQPIAQHLQSMYRSAAKFARAPRTAVRLLLTCTLLALLAQPALAGTISVQIDGVDGDLKTAANAAAEIAQYNGREVSAAQARRLHDRAPQQIAKALEAYGYYNARASGELQETAQGFAVTMHGPRRADHGGVAVDRDSRSGATKGRGQGLEGIRAGQGPAFRSRRL
jgi:hypothetical protein